MNAQTQAVINRIRGQRPTGDNPQDPEGDELLLLAEIIESVSP